MSENQSAWLCIRLWKKRKRYFPISVSIGSSMSCGACVFSFCARSLHQQSALTILREVFTFAPVDG
jgi:hypothetical protein